MALGPRQLLLIRHAKKPDDHENPHLSARGFARASTVPLLFRSAVPCKSELTNAPHELTVHGQVAAFANLPQRLLFGDTAE